MKTLKFFIQHFWPSLVGVLRKRCWRLAWERGQYMLFRKFRPLTVEGFRIEHGGHIVGFWYIEVEQGLFNTWPELMPEAPVIIDVGANSGVFGWCCRKRWPKATIIGIEPHPQLAEECRKLKYRNAPVYDKVHPVALFDSACNKELFVTTDGGFTASLHRGFYGAAKVEPVNIRCVPGDSLELPRADLVKIDVDGAELEVVRGAHRAFGMARYLIIEVEAHELQNVKRIAGRHACRRISDQDYLFYPVS